MRVVSLGFSLPDPRVDNHSIANAPALFEYDACVIDPAAVSRQIEDLATGAGATSGGIYQTPSGTPVLPGASGAFHFGLGELLEQRRRELQLLLERGGAVAVFGYPTTPHTSVSTLPGADRYTILPASPGVVYRPPQLLAGAGGGPFTPLDRAHPFAAYLDDLAGRLRFQAWWDVNAISDFNSVGTVLARSQGGAAVAVEFQVSAGRVVFLPPPSIEPRGAARRNVTEALLESLLRSLETPEAEQAPSWIKDYDLPDLRELRKTVEQAEQSFTEAESRLQEVRAALVDGARYQGLLWREGRYAFEPLVRDALRALGFTVTPELTDPAELADGDEIALLEVDASAHTVKESSYFQLQRRIEKEFVSSGELRKGVIVVNGKRLVHPKDRDEALSQTLINASANFGYALITGESLFQLVRHALEGADAETLAAIRRTILEAEGLVVIEEEAEEEEQEEESITAEPGGTLETETAEPAPTLPLPQAAGAGRANEDNGSDGAAETSLPVAAEEGASG